MSSSSSPVFYAIDTETDPIAAPTYGWANKTRTSPPDIPALILGSIAGPAQVPGAVRSPALLHSQLRLLLSDGAHLVFHNCAFDIPVLCKAFPDLRPPFIAAVDSGRIWDTMILDLLLQIARGSRRTADFVLRPRSLADLAFKHCGLKLNKDSVERTTFSRYKDNLDALPQSYRDYAILDAEATLRVFYAQQPLLRAAVCGLASCRYRSLPDASQRFGPLGHHIQLRGALALAWLGQHPLRVDLHAAALHRERLAAESAALEPLLISFGWARRGPRTGKFSLSHKKLRTALAAFALEHGILDTPHSDTGLLSLDERFWAEHLPRAQPPYVPGSTARSQTDHLALWMRYTRVRKLLGTYLYVYSSALLHYPSYRSIGARTTRTSCHRPNIQNIPKSRDSIRSLFIPRPGYKLIEADFRAAELCALAQVYHLLYGHSNLAAAINANRDPHFDLACRLKGVDVQCVENMLLLLLVYSAAVRSPQPAVGTILDALEKGSALASTGQLSVSGLALLQTACSSVIPATIQSALIQIISSSATPPPILRTWVAAPLLTIPDLAARIGREAFLWIATRTADFVEQELPLPADIERIVESSAQRIRKHGSKLIRAIIERAGLVTKQDRQASKAVSFGMPAGLGYRKLALIARRSYGVTLTEPEAQDLRARALEADPALAAYLSDTYDPKQLLDLAAANLGLPIGHLMDLLRASDPRQGLRALRAWYKGSPRYELPEPPGFNRRFDLFRSPSASLSGSTRGNCSYTEAHNFPFQAGVADASKWALWELYKLWHSAGPGPGAEAETSAPGPAWSPVAFVHDSVLIEVRNDSASLVRARSDLESAMLSGLRALFPDIPGAGVDISEPLECWGK